MESTINSSPIPLGLSMEPADVVHLHVTLPVAVYSKYLRESIAKSKAISAVLADRLAKYADSADEKPILFSDIERRKIEALLKRNVSSAEELTEAVLKACAIEVGGMKVQLYPKLADRLQSRAMHQPLDKFISRIVTQALEEYVGLR